MLLNTAINVIGYVESKYNILCSIDNGSILLYNSLYKQLLLLDASEYDIIKSGVIDASSDFGKALIEMKFVVPPTDNEFEYYKYHP